MPKQILTESEWSRNVGTPAFPVSFLHEYAVGLLWDALHNEPSVVVKTIDGSMSGNLTEGVDRVVIPDSMQPIGGCIPDLALLDKNLYPLRVIEVIVTGRPSQTKMENLASLQKRGVEVVQVPVRNEEELKALVAASSDTQRVKWAYRWNRTVFNQMGIINLPQQRHIRSTQHSADKTVESLIRALVQCRPETRRQLAKVLEELDSLESSYPLSPKNPKRKARFTNEGET